MKKVIIRESNILEVAGNGALGTSVVGEGRIIPVLILDCSAHRNLLDVVLLHESEPPGDVETAWAFKRFNKRHIYLKLEFTRPASAVAYVRFRLTRHADLVDGIMKSHAVYIQPLEYGKKVIEGLERPKVLVEVAAELAHWKSLYQTSTESRYRRAGHNRREARVLAREHIARMSEVWAKRMRSSG